MLRTIGDFGLEINDVCLPAIYCIPMSTAIVKIYTPEGFVLAADGYGSDGRTEAQKVFEIKSEVGALACCLSNRAEISDPKTGVNIQFDSVCNLVANDPRLRNTTDLHGYADIFSRAFGKHVQEQVHKAKEQGLFDSKEKRILKKDWTTDLHFAGYFRGTPSITVSKVRFHGAKLSVLHSCHPNLKYFTGTFYGSEKVLQALKDGDARFAQYASPVFGIPRTVSIADAIDAAAKYIEACSSPEGRKFDPDYCNCIGGRIRFAKITPSGGFEWIERLRENP